MQNSLNLVINPLAYRKNSLVLLLCLVLLAGVQSFGVYRYFNIPLKYGSIDASISWVLIGLLVFFTTNTLAYYHPQRGKVLYVLLLPLFLSYLWIKLTEVIITAIIHEPGYELFFDNTSFYRVSVCYLILAGTTLFSLVWYRLGEKQDESRRQEETERMAKEAELFKLRQQLQPHFLFNSLNSINSLIGSRPNEARTMIQQLSDFLRGTLKREDQKYVSLGEEMEYLKLYLNIEQLRFGHRLKVNIHCDEDLMEWKLPPLILQPILENAIKFGLYGTTDNLNIEFYCRRTDNMLVLTIENPFDEDMQPTSGTGFGLRSVKRRLFLLYARTDLLDCKAEEGIFTVHLKIPKIYD